MKILQVQTTLFISTVYKADLYIIHCENDIIYLSHKWSKEV